MNPLRRFYRRSHRLRRFVRRRKDALTYHAVRVALWLPRQVSLATALRLADRVGDIIYAVDRKTRERSLAHLDVAYGDALSRDEKERIARAALRNAARCFVEVTHMEDLKRRFDDGYVTVDGWEHVRAVLEAGKGAIVVTGHIGNWEILAAYFAGRGIPIAGIAKQMNDPRLNRLLVDFRARNGVRAIIRESPSSGREILQVLRQRGVLALLIDQDIQAPSVSVPFFGRPARTPAAAAALAVRRDLPIVPAFARRRPDGGHQLTVLPPLHPPRSGDRRADVVTLTHRCGEIIEAQVRENPTEWVWWHKRWRRRPVPRLDLDAEFHYQNTVLS
ncbi:lysophospholipid acyltransferase family protein [bacterium]|nr:lysophospholipid acyltransferase family protein [bacterium]